MLIDERDEAMKSNSQSENANSNLAVAQPHEHTFPGLDLGRFIVHISFLELSSLVISVLFLSLVSAEDFAVTSNMHLDIVSRGSSSP